MFCYHLCLLRVSIFIIILVVINKWNLFFLFLFFLFRERNKEKERERTKASVRAANATPRDDKRGPFGNSFQGLQNLGKKIINKIRK